MEYKKFDNIIIARIDKGEEILEQLKAIAINENIKLASINAIGAVNDFTVGVYKTDEKKYFSNSFKGYYEITSLTGTISTMNGEYCAHLHMSAGNEKGAPAVQKRGGVQHIKLLLLSQDEKSEAKCVKQVFDVHIIRIRHTVKDGA